MREVSEEEIILEKERESRRKMFLELYGITRGPTRGRNERRKRINIVITC